MPPVPYLQASHSSQSGPHPRPPLPPPLPQRSLLLPLRSLAVPMQSLFDSLQHLVYPPAAAAEAQKGTAHWPKGAAAPGEVKATSLEVTAVSPAAATAKKKATSPTLPAPTAFDLATTGSASAPSLAQRSGTERPTFAQGQLVGRAVPSPPPWGRIGPLRGAEMK